MVFRAYSMGVMAAYIFIMAGALIYIKYKDIQAFGAKMSIFGAAIFLAMVWPVSVPAAVGFLFKTAAAQIMGLLSKDAYDKVDEKVK